MSMNIESSEFNVVAICPLCEERSLHLIRDELNTRQCINCGYASSDKMILDGELESNPEYNNLSVDMKEWTKTSTDGYMWIPTFMTLPFGMLFPLNDTDENGTTMVWAFAPLQDVLEEEKEKYQDGKGGYYKQRYNTDESIIFDTFLGAMHHMNETAKQMGVDVGKSKI